jgi:hypothetical protein
MLRPTLSSASPNWNKASIWGVRPDLYYFVPKSKSKSHCDWRSVNQYVLVSSPIWGSWPDIYYSLTVKVLFLWGTLSDERTGLSFVAGLRQRSLSRVRVPWHLWPYFTVSDLRLPFSSPPTTLRVTMEVFDPASTRLLCPFTQPLLLRRDVYWSVT